MSFTSNIKRHVMFWLADGNLTPQSVVPTALGCRIGDYRVQENRAELQPCFRVWVLLAVHGRTACQAWSPRARGHRAGLQPPEAAAQ
eukprot:16438675-Heterocapsa_arctica.AAC.1